MRKRELTPAEKEIQMLCVQARKRVGLSQVELAGRMELKQSDISRIEGGKRSPGADIFLAWMRICHATAEELGLESLTPDYDELRRELAEARGEGWLLKLPPMEGDPEGYMGLTEAGIALRCSKQTLYTWIRAGRLAAYKDGRETRVRRADIDELRKGLGARET